MRIKDIAREAGVSTATVSHVINKTKYVSDETREKVQQAIKKFNYHPNAHAQMLALGRSKMIGLLVSDISNPFFPEIIKSIEAAVFASGYHLILLNTNYETGRAVEYVQRLIQMKVAGIILMIAEFDDALIEEAKRKKTSFVFHDLGIVGEKMSNIILDYAVGIDEAVAASCFARAQKNRPYRRLARDTFGRRSSTGIYRFDEAPFAERAESQNL